MKSGAAIALALAVAVLAAGAGYRLGRQSPAGVEGATTAGPAKQERKLLYYRNPMGLPDTSPTPKKDPMGMDYVPVYEGEAEAAPAAANQVSLSTEKIQKLGVRTARAELGSLARELRASGRVVLDERRSFTIAPKFEGYVERLHVNATGQPVAQGQPLFEVYSPELVSAQREYTLAAEGVEALKAAGGEARRGMADLAAASLARLRNWDVSEEQIRALARTGIVRRTLTFGSPVSGIVTEKKALQGMRFMPGEVLYQVADLSSVWVLADVFEQDIGLLRVGTPARVRVDAYPDKVFEGRVGYVYPTLDAATRTLALRIELANPGQLLKPGMFAQVLLPVGARAPVLSVPDSAVIDSGTRRIVLVALGAGRFAPREVRLGAKSESRVEVLAGLEAGEEVVVAANFLIDAESRLQAALGGLAGAAAATPPAASAKAVGHHAEGVIDSLDAAAGTLMLSHGPVASLKWPAMTMEFRLANPALRQGLQPGARVAFEFVERQPGEWVITALTPAPAPHAGH